MTKQATAYESICFILESAGLSKKDGIVICSMLITQMCDELNEKTFLDFLETHKKALLTHWKTIKKEGD